MIFSEKALKWALCLYPPFLFQRIWVKKIHPGFMGVDVKINNSFLNRNYNGSIFGGSIYAATDPFYAVLFDQLMQRKGFKVRVWLKSATIQYLKPGLGNLHFTIVLNNDMIAEAEAALNEYGKFIKSYPMELYNEQGVLCATVMNEIYVRHNFPGEEKRVAI